MSLTEKRPVAEQSRASAFNAMPVAGTSTIGQFDRASLAGPEPTLLQGREFETVLNKTRVYSRVKHREPDGVSSTSSGVWTTGWSMLSSGSLADISALSIFRLPLPIEHIPHLGSGLTFANDYMEPTASTSPRGWAKRLAVEIANSNAPAGRFEGQLLTMPSCAKGNTY